MNRSKHPLSIRVRKKINKEIRTAIPAKEANPTSDDIKADDLLSRYRGKSKKKGAAALKSLTLAIANKKNKRTAKHSKRTTPGKVDLESPPKDLHIEGTRWIKTIQKQNLEKNKILTKKILKKGRLK